MNGGFKKEGSGGKYDSESAAEGYCEAVVSDGNPQVCYVYEKIAGNLIGKFCAVYPEHTPEDCRVGSPSDWALRNAILAPSGNDPCSNPSTDDGKYACRRGDVDLCLDGSWTKVDDCSFIKIICTIICLVTSLLFSICTVIISRINTRPFSFPITLF
jgi:hypothetical protein